MMDQYCVSSRHMFNPERELGVFIPSWDNILSVHSVYFRPQCDTGEATNAENSLTYDQYNPLSPNTRHGASDGLMLDQYRRLWANIGTKLFVLCLMG